MPIHNNDDKCFEFTFDGKKFKYYYMEKDEESKKRAYQASIRKMKILEATRKPNFVR